MPPGAEAVLAFVLQLAQLLPLPVAVRLALPSHGFLAWRGLFTDPAQHGPLLTGLAVDLAWAVVAVTVAYGLFVRRDFTDTAYDGPGGRVLTFAALPLVAVLLVSGLAVAATGSTGTGIDRPKLEENLAESFGHLYRLQTRELGRPAVTEAQLRASADCDKGGSTVLDEGPGNDWRCVVTWHLPDSGPAVGSAIYQLDVTPDGRYVADGDGPQQVNGSFTVHTPPSFSGQGDAPNPLWQLDGDVDLLAHHSKG